VIATATMPARVPPRTVQSIAVTRWAAHVPGPPPSADWLAGLVRGGAEPAERAHELLGRKGLLAKEPATRLGLCAVHRLLGRPPRAPRPEGPPDPRTAVVVACNLGNVEAVVRVARTVREGCGRDVSALDAPNASSNVIASSIAIWFRCGGPNLMVCSGATAGLDAMRLGALLLSADRADRVVVVGAEPQDEVACALRGLRRRPGGGLRAAAAAVMLERAAGPAAGAPTIGPIAAMATSAVVQPPGGSICLAPRTAIGEGAGALDVEAELGDTYGALGVLQVAAAAELLAAGRSGTRVTVLCGDPRDGWRMTTLNAAPAQEEVER
jgi:3-oxoacyl-[acyl-carrier-protein] synthase II